MTVRRAALAAAVTALVSGCSTVATLPDCYGGTRGLFRDPFPITDAQFNLGSTTGTRYAGPMGLIAINTLWLLDLPLSFALDTVLFPFTVWTLPSELEASERKERQAAEREADLEAREARFVSWRADPGLAATALGDQTPAGVSQSGVHYEVGSDAVRFLSDLGPRAATWLPQIEAHVERYLETHDTDPELGKRRWACEEALWVLKEIGSDAAPAFPSVHAVLRREFERKDEQPRRGVLLCHTLGSLGAVSAAATPELVRMINDPEHDLGAGAHAPGTLKEIVEALREQGGEQGAAGLRTVLAVDGLPDWLRSKAELSLKAIERE